MNSYIAGELRPYQGMKDSGVKWLGKIPSHWKVLPNRTLFEEVKERDHPEEQMLSVTIKRGVIRQNELLDESSQKDSSNLDKSAYKQVKPGDIAYNKMRAWQGAMGVSEYQGIVSPAYVVERPRKGVNSNFSHYLLRTPGFAKEAERWSYGINSDMWSLRPEHFKMIYTCLPPLQEQAAIVRFLDHADRRIQRYIRAKQKLIALLEEQRKAATQEVIQSRSVTSNKIEVVADLVERPIHRVATDTYTPIGLYNRGRGIFKKEPRNGGELGDSDFFWVEEGDLVLSGQFAWEGAIALAGGTEFGCVASHRYPILQGRHNVLDSGFLLAFFQTDWGQLLLDHHSRGAAGRNRPLNARTLLKEKIPLPPLRNQMDIVKMLRREKMVRQQVEDSKRLLNEYQTRLISDVVTGKLDVREAAAELPEEDVHRDTEKSADEYAIETDVTV